MRISDWSSDVCSSDLFNSLPQEDQQAIEGLSGEAFATLCGKAWDVADQEGLQAAQKAGNSITEASPEMVANLREELSVLESAWIAAAGGQGVDGAAALGALRPGVPHIGQ